MENKAKHNKMKHRDIIKMVKRNETQEFVSGLKHYVLGNVKNITIVAISVLVIGIVVPLFLNLRENNNLKAEQILSQANYFLNRPVLDDPQAAMYGFFRTNKEKYEKAQSFYMTVLRDYKWSDALPSAYLGLANSYYDSEQYKKAMEYFNSFISKFPNNTLIAEAYSGKAYTLFQMGQYAEAILIWESVQKKFNGGNNPNDIKLRVAESYIKTGNKVAAKAICEEMIKSDKEDYWTSAAKEMILKTK
ncbi:MAG: tetratricopeptide repeat protein [bacterium]